MKRPEDKPLVCRYCDEDLIAGDVCIRTAGGPMHDHCERENRERVAQLIADALAEGTHTTKQEHFCGICRQLVESIYYVGFDGTRMCPACADSHAGQGPVSDARQQRERQQKWERERRQLQVAA